MNKFKEVVLENITLGKLVHGGQAISNAPDGRKLLVWGGLPGEVVDVLVTKKRKDYLEGIVNRVNTPSIDRIEPIEPGSYLSTSPWQIMTYDLENSAKQEILEEAFSRAGLENVSFSDFVVGEEQTGYRNKMEIGFWGDDLGIHLAHYVRGTHGKQIVEGSILANKSINTVALGIITSLNDFANKTSLRAGDLKTVVLRCSKAGEVVGALFVKDKINFQDFQLPSGLKGLVIYYSDPKSPASVATKELYTFGDINLSDDIMGVNITYDVNSFFQVNIPLFEQALETIKAEVNKELSVDLYSGVGTIGVVVGSDELIEIDGENIKKAKENVAGTKTNVIQASSEQALSHILEDKILIVDPPRAGLHKKVIDRIYEVTPKKIIYLSCNPSTMARDLKSLDEKYEISSARGFNFFPRTPHIECLVVLKRI